MKRFPRVMAGKLISLFDLRIPPSPPTRWIIGTGAVALIVLLWFLATYGATAEQPVGLDEQHDNDDEEGRNLLKRGRDEPAEQHLHHAHGEAGQDAQAAETAVSQW